MALWSRADRSRSAGWTSLHQLCCLDIELTQSPYWLQFSAHIWRLCLCVLSCCLYCAKLTVLAVSWQRSNFEGFVGHWKHHWIWCISCVVIFRCCMVECTVIYYCAGYDKRLSFGQSLAPLASDIVGDVVVWSRMIWQLWFGSLIWSHCVVVYEGCLILLLPNSF